MKSPRQRLALWQALLIACLCFGFGRIAAAQSSAGTPAKKADGKSISVQEQRERGIARCRENRGVDCDKPEGQKEWVRQEHPITDEERARAAAARRAREALKRF